MKQVLLTISDDSSSFKALDVGLSFKPFFDFLNTKQSSEETVKSDLYSFLIKKFNQYPELKNSIDINISSKYIELLELIYTGMTGITSKKLLWALATPDAGTLFYGTDTIYDLLKNIKSVEENKNIFNAKNENLQLSLIYSTILERFYQYNSIIKREILGFLSNDNDGTLKYYEMNIDSTFIEVTCSNELPKLDFRELETHINDNTLLSYLNQSLPLHLFSFKGFSIISLHDCTEEFALKKIKDCIANSSLELKENIEIIEALKALGGNKQINFGLIPLIKLNNKFLFDFSKTLISNTSLQSVIEKFQDKPRPIFLKDLTKNNDVSNPLIIELKNSGITAYGLLPLLDNNQLTGILEVYTNKENLLNETILSGISLALPLLAEFMMNIIDDFNLKITNVIYENFTSIQPPVQWKFMEAAWHYMQSGQTLKGYTELENIDFKNVYPLYGSIDVRNFSIERANALVSDFKNQLHFLIETLTAIRPTQDNGLLPETIEKCNNWVAQLNDAFDENKKQKLTAFIESEVHPLLGQIKQVNKASSDIVDTYLKAILGKSERIQGNRQNLEASLEMITKVIANSLELMNDEFQKVFPFYFDKFRSDGIEYDIYIGQSIAPDKAFTPEHLRNLKLLQLRSMVNIFKLVHRLKMPRQLHITELIFINGEPINIYFRKDEKRFDIEGTHSIRYQMVKKRIDKVNVLNTEERLTQVGKIAMVYLNKKDADEYVNYIHELQKENLLNNDLEYLELEELQGIQGIKALRVSITINDEAHPPIKKSLNKME